MKLNIKTFLTAVLAMSAWTLCAQETPKASKGVVIDKIVAKVDDYIILKSEVEQAYLDYISRGEISAGNARCQVLESLVINKLMVAKAEIDSVIVPDAEVYQNLDRRMQYFVAQIGSEEAIEKYYGKKIEEFRQELFDDIKEQLVVQKMQEEITQGVKVTPAEVRKFFKRIPKDSLPFFSTEVEVAQIVKDPVVSKTQKDLVRAELNTLRERILNGEDFGDLAKKYSMDPGSAAMGGNLGFFKRGELAPEFEATALSLKPGEMSRPVETDFGFHLIQLVERRGNTFNSRHILMIPSSSDDDLKEAIAFLDSIRTLIVNDSITFSKAAKEFSDSKETASSGGFFLDGTGTNRVSVEEIDPVLFFTLDTMKVGTITQPLVYEKEDGSKSARILYYHNRIPPHQANLDQDYQKIQSATKAEKRNKILGEWFLKAQADVFVFLDPEYNYCDLLNQAN